MKNAILRYVSLTLFATFLFISQPVAQQVSPAPLIIRMENASAEDDMLLYRFPTWTDCTPAPKKDLTLIGDMEGREVGAEPSTAPPDAADPPDAAPPRYDRWGHKMPPHFPGGHVSDEPIHTLRYRAALGVFIEEADNQVRITGLHRRWLVEGASIQAGDVLLAIDDQPVASAADVEKMLEPKLPGEWVRLTVQRDGAGRLEVNHRLTSMRYVVLGESNPCDPFIGVTTSREDMPTAEGLQVLKVHPGTPAEAAGVQPGDRILGMDGRPIGHIHAMRMLRDQHQPGDAFSLTLLRDGKVIEVSARFKSCEETNGETVEPDIETNDMDLDAGPRVRVYPNPASELLGVELLALDAEQAEVSIFDEQGRQVYYQKVMDVPSFYSLQIPLHDLPAGMLVVKVKSGDQVLTRKVMHVMGE